MEVNKEQYTFDFADKNKEDRDQELQNLIAVKEYLMGMRENTDTRNTYDENGNSNSMNSQQKVLSTSAGKRMSDDNQQRGFSSALMLGVISFIFEITFLALSVFMYK